MRSGFFLLLAGLGGLPCCARGRDVVVVEGSTESTTSADASSSAVAGGGTGDDDAAASTSSSGQGGDGGDPGPGQGGAGAIASTSTTVGPGGGGAGGSGPAPVAPGALVITEIMANPDVVSDATGEWFEVLNVSDGPVPLGGLVLRHEPGDPAAVLTLATDAVLAAGQRFVLGKGIDPSNNGGVAIDYLLPAELSLTNTGDALTLERADGTVIDHTAWGEVPRGASVSLDPSFTDASLNDDGAHFCAAVSVMPAGDRGTPGASNDPCP